MSYQYVGQSIHNVCLWYRAREKAFYPALWLIDTTNTHTHPHTHIRTYTNIHTYTYTHIYLDMCKQARDASKHCSLNDNNRLIVVIVVHGNVEVNTCTCKQYLQVAYPLYWQL